MLDRSLVAPLDESVIDYWGAYALADGGRHKRLHDALFMQTVIPLSLFNSVILTGRDPRTIEEALDLAADCARSVGVPVLWRVSPLAENDELRARLVGAGLKVADSQPAMLADLGDLPPPPAVEGLVIATAEGPADRRAWGRRALAAFEMTYAIGEAMGACEATIPQRLHEHHLRYTAYLDGEAVGVSSLVMTNGIAGIYAVATLPKARKRGVGAAMTLHAMSEGRRRGATTATLQASSMGRPVYERLGFRTIYHYQLYRQS